MMALLERLQILHDLMRKTDDEFVKRVTSKFRDEYLRHFQADKLAYLNEVLDKQALSNQEVLSLLGYHSRSAINAMRKGEIAHDKFELLVATLGSKVPWPPASDRKGRAAIATIRYVRDHELKKPPASATLDKEGYECLEQAFCESIERRSLEHEQATDEWLSFVFGRVRAVVETKRITTEPQFVELLKEWGEAYAKTKWALGLMLREHA